MGKHQVLQKKLGKSASETFQMIKQAYSEEALGRSAVFKWRKHFAQGRNNMEDDEHMGRPRMVRTKLQDPKSCNVGVSQLLPNGR
jgi:hypothetical protein